LPISLAKTGIFVKNRPQPEAADQPVVRKESAERAKNVLWSQPMAEIYDTGFGKPADRCMLLNFKVGGGRVSDDE